MEEVLRAGQFSIEDDFGPYGGYTYGRYWNGWACPYFPREVADAICAVWNRYTASTLMACTYDASSDTYTFSDPENDGGESYTVTGEIHTVNGEAMRLYPVGNGYWIWDQDDPA
jgi:hypothetical protein